MIEQLIDQAKSQLQSWFNRSDIPGDGFRLIEFGEPEPVLAQNLGDWLGVFLNTWGYYEPPVSLRGLARIAKATPYHGPILHFQKDSLTATFIPSPILTLDEFTKAALDYRITGNCFFLKRFSRLGTLIGMERRPAITMRVGINPDQYFEIPTQKGVAPYFSPIEYRPGEILHIKEHDPEQDIYGLPAYFGGIQSVLLGEAAVLFRRKFYQNGAHTGYIFVADANFDDKTAKALETEIGKTRGLGNFRNLFVNLRTQGANRSKEPIKIIPVGSIETKDDVEKLQAITQAHALAMHGMQPGLAGIIPQGFTGWGDLDKVEALYMRTRVRAMQAPFIAANTRLPTGKGFAFTDVSQRGLEPGNP